MISLTDSVPRPTLPNAELIKLNCTLDCYGDTDTALFWRQDNDRAVIGMTDGNMVIYNKNADTDELSEFVSAIGPCCVFSDIDTLCRLSLTPKESVSVMHRAADIDGQTDGDCLNSREIYDLLDVNGLSLPEYPYFAVDYCRRLNRGAADYFAISGKCAAISFCTGEFAIMNGIASHKKGYGGIALKAILQKNHGRDFVVCCRQSVKGFYEKNGFCELYKAGYWVKNI